MDDDTADNDDASMAAWAFIWRMNELIEEARERGLSNEGIADALEDLAGVLRSGILLIGRE